MKNNRQVKMAIEQYADIVQRICFVYLKNHGSFESQLMLVKIH